MIFNHLLPGARAWRITVDKPLRQFFEGLTVIDADVKEFADLIFYDIDPQTTRELEQWEAQFALPNVLTVEQDRRDRLAATWQALGGQSPRYIQDTLRNAGFDVYVHEWWEVPVVGSPVARNPLLYLNDGSLGALYLVTCGSQVANCGNGEAVCGASLQTNAYPLVNKILIALQGVVCGSQLANCGNAEAVCGARQPQYSQKQYTIPLDSAKWPYFLYIGGQAFPDHASVPTERRNELETLCLKICPTQQWLGMLIDYI